LRRWFQRTSARAGDIDSALRSAGSARAPRRILPSVVSSAGQIQTWNHMFCDWNYDCTAVRRMSRKRRRNRRKQIPLPADPYESARVAGLRYVIAEGPGIVRKRAGRGFCYIGIDGKPVCDRDELKRIR